MAKKLSCEQVTVIANKICKILGYGGLLLGMNSCSSGPRAQPIEPASAVITNVALEENGTSSPVIEYSANLPDDWWQLFNDEQLVGFIETTLEKNPTLQAAQAKILSAAYNARQVKAALFPTLSWNGDVSRQKLSQTALIPFGIENSPIGTPGGAGLPVTAGSNGIPVYFTQYETELAFTYDFDIWGKNRDLFRAALGEIQATIADEAFSRLELTVAVAMAYFKLQIDYKRLEIAQALVANREKYTELVEHRVNGNISNIQPVHVARSNQTGAKQQLLQIQGDIAVNEYQLKAYLAGDFDEEISDTKVVQQPLPKVPMPQDLPMHLLSRRPDITAQLWLIESAGKQIEVAKAGFYPDVSITAFLGYQTIHLHELFRNPSRFFNVDPAFTLPIFEGGRLIANLRGSEVNYDLAIYDYNQLVLNAVRDVLTGVAVLLNQEQQLQEAVTNKKTQEDLFGITALQVKHNIASNLDYLTSELSALQARDQEFVAIGNKIQAILALIKALGGGYESCNL